MYRSISARAIAPRIHHVSSPPLRRHLTAVVTGCGAPALAIAAEYDHPAAIDPASITVTTVDGDETLAQFDQVRVDRGLVGCRMALSAARRSGSRFRVSSPEPA